LPSQGHGIIEGIPVSVGQLFPATDPLSRWMFSLSALADDLAVLDHMLQDSWDDAGSPTFTYFRLIVARIYEGERIVTAMDAHARTAGFLAGVPKATDASARLRAAYRRDLSVRNKAEQSHVERTFARARHLTVHYPQRAELARILRDAHDLEARAWQDHAREELRYLWPQNVMEHALWPRGAEHRPDIELAHELAQAFVDVFRYALGPYVDEMGVNREDLTFIESEDREK
jgi:hypothetical protein